MINFACIDKDYEKEQETETQTKRELFDVQVKACEIEALPGEGETSVRQVWQQVIGKKTKAIETELLGSRFQRTIMQNLKQTMGEHFLHRVHY